VSSSRRSAARSAEARAGGVPRRLASVRRLGRDWAGTLLRPQVLIAFVALVAAVPYLLGSFGGRPADASLPPLGPAAGETLREVEMPLVIVDVGGGVRSALATVRAADHEAARLTAALAALRDVLVDEDVWPEAVAAPSAAIFESNRRRVVVVDVVQGERVAVSVAQEWAALRSLVETMRAAGADDVRIIVNGEVATTLWGHVALP
jgi:hypothetical protein